MPVSRGNQAIAQGKLQKMMPDILGQLKPEAAYFGAMDGNRTALIFCDLSDTSMIPATIEPFFMGLEAEINIYPVMNAEDLMKGIGGLEELAKRYL